MFHAKWRNYSPLDKVLVFFLALMTLVAIFMAACPAKPAHAMGPLSVTLHTLAWDREADPLVTGYYVYWRTTGTTPWLNTQRSVAVLQPAVGTIPTFDLSTFNLPNGNYDICATAIDAAGDESGPSAVLPFTVYLPAFPMSLRKQ
jgi:hypothetical protein